MEPNKETIKEIAVKAMYEEREALLRVLGTINSRRKKANHQTTKDQLNSIAVPVVDRIGFLDFWLSGNDINEADVEQEVD